MFPLKESIVGAPLVADAGDPNASPPIAARIWTVPQSEATIGEVPAMQCSLDDGTSAITQAWELINGAALWTKVAGQQSLAALVKSAPFGDFQRGSSVFLQIVGVGGAPTTLRAGFVMGSTDGGLLAQIANATPAAGSATLAASTPVNEASTALTPLADLTLTSGAATRAIVTSTPCRGLLVVSDPGNTVIIRYGDSTVDATHGPKLSVGGNAYIPIDNANKVYFYTGSASQVVQILVFS